jgi:hypothetical protein
MDGEGLQGRTKKRATRARAIDAYSWPTKDTKGVGSVTTYNLNLNVKVESEDLAGAYEEVAKILAVVKTLGEITKVDINDKGSVLPGHVPGCRGTTRGGTGCTCSTPRIMN